MPCYELDVLDKSIDNTFETIFMRDYDECTITGKIVKVGICAKETYNSYILFADGAFIICNKASGYLIHLGKVHKITAWAHESRFEGDCFTIRSIKMVEELK